MKQPGKCGRGVTLTSGSQLPQHPGDVLVRLSEGLVLLSPFGDSLPLDPGKWSTYLAHQSYSSPVRWVPLNLVEWEKRNANMLHCCRDLFLGKKPPRSTEVIRNISTRHMMMMMMMMMMTMMMMGDDDDDDNA